MTGKKNHLGDLYMLRESAWKSERSSAGTETETESAGNYSARDSTPIETRSILAQN